MKFIDTMVSALHSKASDVRAGLIQRLDAVPMELIKTAPTVISNIRNSVTWEEIFNNGTRQILPNQALNYYQKCAPLFTGIDWLAEGFAGLVPKVFDQKAEKYIDHPVLELLARPFGNQNWTQFATEFASYYITTGNNYMIATGQKNTPPLELMNVYTPAVNILPAPYDGYAGRYIVTTPFYSVMFDRDITDGYFRYFDVTDGKQLWHTRRFNPRQIAAYGNFGMSILTPIYLELEQHYNSSMHNLSLLRKGTFPTGAFKTDKELTDDQFQRYIQQIRDQYQGSVNAGVPLMMEGGLDFISYGMNNKDMDFLQLKKEITERIYNALRIPIALMSVEKATMNNMDQSVLMLYDFGILPLARYLFQELTTFLMPRYKGSENLILGFRTDNIPALAARELANVKIKQGLYVFKTNELRAELDKDPVDGGDEVLVPNTSAPLSIIANPPEEAEPEDDDSDPTDPAQQEEDENDTAKFLEELSHLKFANGTKLFNNT